MPSGETARYLPHKVMAQHPSPVVRKTCKWPGRGLSITPLLKACRAPSLLTTEPRVYHQPGQLDRKPPSLLGLFHHKQTSQGLLCLPSRCQLMPRLLYKTPRATLMWKEPYLVLLAQCFYPQGLLGPKGLGPPLSSKVVQILCRTEQEDTKVPFLQAVNGELFVS